MITVVHATTKGIFFKTNRFARDVNHRGSLSVVETWKDWFMITLKMTINKQKYIKEYLGENNEPFHLFLILRRTTLFVVRVVHYH